MAKRREKCSYHKTPRGERLVCVEKRKHGFAAWLYGKSGGRIPVHIPGKPTNLTEAMRAAKRWLRQPPTPEKLAHLRRK